MQRITVQMHVVFSVGDCTVFKFSNKSLMSFIFCTKNPVPCLLYLQSSRITEKFH